MLLEGSLAPLFLNYALQNSSSSWPDIAVKIHLKLVLVCRMLISLMHKSVLAGRRKLWSH